MRLEVCFAYKSEAVSIFSVSAMSFSILDVPYFHTVFTIPDELYPLVYSNQKLLYDALYHAAHLTMTELSADSKHLGAKIGYICVLHTWGSRMNYHPHLHMIVLEFLRMFLMHVLPKGFVRIRHYGILSCRSKKEKMNLCRKLLNCVRYQSRLRNKTVAEKLMILYQKDICKCGVCGGKLLSTRLHGNYALTG